jgi:hypothetical protein
MSDLASKHLQSTNGIGAVTGNGDGDAGDASVAATNGVGNAGNGTASNIAGNGNAGGAAPAPVDAFSDLSKLRLDQSYADIVGVKKLLMTVPVRKPNRQEWVRVHPEFRLPGAPIIELKDDRESFLVTPAVATQLSPGDFSVKDLFLSLSRQNVLFVWPVTVPTTDGRGRGNAWHTSAREAAVLAETKWVRLSANLPLGAYDVTEPPPLVKLPDPEWPLDKTFNDILRIAFKDRLIETADHPVIQRLLCGA